LGCDLASAIEINKKRNLNQKEKEKTFEDIDKCPPINDLVVLSDLGAGQFGKVLLLSD
jgi:hypothetical protein